MPAKKKVPTKSTVTADQVKVPLVEDKAVETVGVGEYVVKGSPPEVEDYVDEAAEIAANIIRLKADREKNNTPEAIKGILNQLRKEKTAFENGIPITEYAARVMSAQSPDPTVVPKLLGIAKTRKALKKQGYPLEDVERVISILEDAEDAYEV